MTLTQLIKRQANTDLVLEALNSGVRTMVDDHTTHEVREEAIQGYAILSDGYICPIFLTTRYFSLNELYLDEEDNKLHLSTSSVGGVVNLQKYINIDEAVKEFNILNADYGTIEEYKIFKK